MLESDEFLKDLNDYLYSPIQGLIAYATVLEATLTTTSLRDLNRVIGATLDAKLNESDKERLLPEIKAKLSALFSKNVDEDLTIESNHSFLSSQLRCRRQIGDRIRCKKLVNIKNTFLH
jgi:2C-methyl-D-erythritol 2,4-cyclodiphosphate synthase